MPTDRTLPMPRTARGCAWPRFAGARAAFALLSLALLSTAPAASAADWPQWRGPTRDGISTETGWSHAWGREGPTVLWKAQVGIGCSSFSAAGDRAYTMGNKANVDTVYCFDVQSGKILWSHAYPQKLDPNLYEGGPGCTPAIDGDRVYTLSKQGLLFCLREGKVVWKRDLAADFGAKMPKWGWNNSPLVLGDRLLLDVGGKGSSAVALDKLTGKVLWKAGDDPAAYSSPIVVRSEGGDAQVAFLNAWGLVVRSASDGREHWRFPWKTNYDCNAAIPVIVGDAIFLSSGYGHGCALVQPGAGGAKALWSHKDMRNHVNSSVLWQGHLYGFDESSFNCLDAATGAVKWKQPGLGKGSLVIADGKLAIMAEQGKLVIARPSPAKFEKLAEAQILPSSRCWVTPTLSNGRLFARNNLGDVVAVDLRAR